MHTSGGTCMPEYLHQWKGACQRDGSCTGSRKAVRSACRLLEQIESPGGLIALHEVDRGGSREGD